jgi:hypothetical protein
VAQLTCGMEGGSRFIEHDRYHTPKPIPITDYIPYVTTRQVDNDQRDDEVDRAQYELGMSL